MKRRRLFRQKQQQRSAKFSNSSSIDAKSYLEKGSIRNTAHDEEFFRVFAQYLDEAIQKLSKQEAEENKQENEEEEEEFVDPEKQNGNSNEDE